MPFKPHQERRLLGSRKTLLIQPVVIGTQIAIDQRPDEVEFWIGCNGRQQFVHRLLPLPRGKSHEQREGLGPPQSFTGGPLRETRAEDLSSRAFSQQADFEALQDFIGCAVGSPGTELEFAL